MVFKALKAIVGLIATASAVPVQKEEEEASSHGVNFYVVGDFGWVQDMTDPNSVFDAIDKTKGSAKKGSIDDGEFFITAGDNLYPADGYNPTDEEFDTMMTLFARDNLKDLKIHAIRGNHDCYFDDNFELDKVDEYEQWEMPNFYYTKEFEVGKNGEKMGVLFVDSCLMLCANYSYAGDSGGHMRLLHAEHKKLRDVVCDDPVTTAKGNEMYEWINKTLIEWDKDEDLLWKTTVLHHPMFGKWYPDFANIVLNFLPMLQEHKFDLYLNGHEHVISYAHYPYSQVPDGDYAHQAKVDYFSAQIDEDFLSDGLLKEYRCQAGQESFFGFDPQLRSIRQPKGQSLHQITTGTSGFDEYDLCLDRPTMGTFTYAQNIKHGWSSVHVDENELRVVSKGVDPETGDVVQMYELVIENRPEPHPDPSPAPGPDPTPAPGPDPSPDQPGEQIFETN